MASTYLTRTPSGAGNRKKWTLSGWYKRSGNAADYLLSSGQYNSTQLSQILFEGDDYFNVAFYSSGASLEGHLETNRKFRDPAAFYHIVVAVDTAQASSSDRVKIYVNGVQETSFKTSTYPAQDYDTSINNNVAQNIGRREGSGFYNGQMAHVHFCDGQAYAASDFGETDSTSGIWVAKTSPSVTYGTNGYFLKFASGASGTDSSGEGNNFTVSGNLTNLKDSPDNNFCTMNPLDNYYGASTFTNGNNTVQTGSSSYTINTATMGMTTGKWYWECKLVADSASGKEFQHGITDVPTLNTTTQLGATAYAYSYRTENGNKENNGSATAYGATADVGDIIGVALDLDNNKIYFHKNGTWQDSGDPTSGATGTGAAFTVTAPASTGGGQYFPANGEGTGVAQLTYGYNFGNGYFGTTAVSSAGTSRSGDDSVWEYDCPTGYYGLNTKNISTYG